MKGDQANHTNSPLNHTGFYTTRLKVISPPLNVLNVTQRPAAWPKGLHEVIFDCLVPSISPGCPAKLIFSKMSSKSESSDSSYRFFFLNCVLEWLFEASSLVVTSLFEKFTCGVFSYDRRHHFRVFLLLLVSYEFSQPSHLIGHSARVFLLESAFEGPQPRSRHRSELLIVSNETISYEVTTISILPCHLFRSDLLESQYK